MATLPSADAMVRARASLVARQWSMLRQLNRLDAKVERIEYTYRQISDTVLGYPQGAPLIPYVERLGLGGTIVKAT